jgi:hypothetical protein
MNNNPCKKTGVFQEINVVVYKFSCNREGCRLLKYGLHWAHNYDIKPTTPCQLQSGGSKNHLMEAHNETITRTMLEECTSAIMRCPDANRLAIPEALIIKDRTPAINLHTTVFVRVLRQFSEWFFCVLILDYLIIFVILQLFLTFLIFE